MPAENFSESSSSGSKSPDNDLKKLSGTQTFQTVFRVSQPGQKKHEFHPRKAHKKSRAGCLTCKKRRVKVCCIKKATLKLQLTETYSATKGNRNAKDAIPGVFNVATQQN